MPNTPNVRLISANIFIEGRRTSVKMEPELWQCLSRICDLTKLTADEIVTFLARQHPGANLTSLIRSYVGHLLIERLEQPLLLSPFRLAQFKGISRTGGVLRLIDPDPADRAEAV